MKKIFPRRWAQIICLLLAGFAMSPATQATVYYVYIDGTGFDPNYLEIQQGDSVFWENFDFSQMSHNSHSATYPWNTGTLFYMDGAGFSFSKTGTYSYQDDFTGLTASVVILTTLPVLTNEMRLPNGTFQLAVTNLTAGKTNILQGSTNLVNWTNLYTNTGSASGFIYVDNAATTLKQRFYRAWVLP